MRPPLMGGGKGPIQQQQQKKKAEKERHEKNGEGSHTNRVGRMQKKKNELSNQEKGEKKEVMEENGGETKPTD